MRRVTQGTWGAIIHYAILPDRQKTSEIRTISNNINTENIFWNPGFSLSDLSKTLTAQMPDRENCDNMSVTGSLLMFSGQHL
jgi:hypothetical protein